MASDLFWLQRPLALTPKPHGQALFIRRGLHRGSTITWKVRCSVTTENFSLRTEGRRSANYQPSSWNYDLLQNLENDVAIETYRDRAKVMEEEVRRMMKNERAEPLDLLELIENIQRLGLGYRFHDEIRAALDRYVSCEGVNTNRNDSLHATALAFRLLRQHGHEVSQDVFNKFKDEKGNFMESLGKDIKGMLSLYEASHFSFEGEIIMDEAKAFAKLRLKDHIQNTRECQAEQVKHALELPSIRRAQRLEARWSIEAYSRSEDANQVLLQLAAIDFNMVQSILQGDIRDVSRWWRGMNLTSKLSFARDRVMESFFWTVGMIFEPQYSYARKELTKVVTFITIIDDVYDVHGTVDELELFTDAVQRWDVNAIPTLPDYMKLCFLALYNTVNEMAYHVLSEKGENILPYLTKAWADLCKSFLQEAKWLYNKYTPTFEEYLENAWMSSSGPLLLVYTNCLLSENITKKQLEGSEKYHDLLRWPSTIFRLCNDLVSLSAEIERGEIANAISCYMNDNGVTEELAREHLRNFINELWKKMNKERLDEILFQRPFIETAVNLARIAHCVYQYGDGHSSPDNQSRKRVLSVILEPVSCGNI